MNPKDIFEGFRKALVEVLVPEIKELNRNTDEKINQLREEMNQLREEMNKRFDKIDARFEKIDERFERMEERFREHDRKFEQLLEAFHSLKTDIGTIKQRDDILNWLTKRIDKLETDIEKIQKAINKTG